MPPLPNLRRAPWLSSVIRLLVLCFALGTLAHAGHTHELDKNSTHASTHYQCDYCTSFGGLIDPPAQQVSLLPPSIPQLIVIADAPQVLARPHSVAQPRAPPFLPS